MKCFMQVSVLRVLIISVSLLVLGACTTVNQKVGEALNLDTDLKLEIKASEAINPDEKNQSSPVFIRLYELTSLKSFEKADFIDLNVQEGSDFYYNEDKTLQQNTSARFDQPTSGIKKGRWLKDVT